MRYFLLLLFFGFVSFSFGQHQDKVDFVRADVYIEPVPLNKEIIGRVVYRFKVLQNVDSVFLDAKDMRFEKVEMNGKQVDFIATDKTISIRKKLKKDTSHELTIAYVAKPRQTVYFLGWGDKIEGNEQVWTQGQGKYTSHWLPSFDDMNEKVEFDLAIQANQTYEVIANGKLLSVSKGENGRPVWLFDMENPMSSYLLAFAIGHYSKQELSSSTGVPILNYFYPQDSARVEPTYRHTRRIFDFLEDEIGVSYPWQDYKQIPVRDFLYAGMENTGATIFSDGYVIDATAFVDKNYVNVNAHELAHQWFGNLVTEKDGSHHWLQEGFATYYAYLAEKEIFGDDHFYWKLFDTAKELREISEGGKGQALVDPKASSATFYEKGAWALVMLRELVGDKPFKKGVSDYLNTHRFKNVTIDDFLREMERASAVNLEGFRVKWLESSEFPWDEAKTYLMDKNEALSAFLGSGHELKDLEKELQAERPVQYKEALVDELAQEILDKDRFAPLFDHPQLKVRQKAIQLIDQISSIHKESAEKLLDDTSYITQELALFKLWSSFPESRKAYLDATKEVIGLPNKNVRLLWLFLAVATDGYEAENTRKYFAELTAYTSPEQGWEVRIGAFQYLREIGFIDEGLANLINATNHHSWQFKKYARGLIGQLLEDQEYKTRIEKLVGKLNQEETRYISTKLN
ncbi:M1 family metallopeptidase [Zobellia galactanivorans]|uniref:M1 family metallopeptidase n=1 Tax=Zobellia galactanivorans (strain DSM 12802 / CCUG 47099 / CIP 106680 / NCIMB 13871 / Dsij) TaxID=63186 RepID=UPI0026E19BF2|nr:M1 family metallopeptidase [Zobellia galactanivorans]MDO6809027.1 M1 family metallopeptidase [Zobellia galactanivorans]